MIERIEFEGHHGDLIAGILHRADEPVGGILLAHCFTCSKDVAINSRLSKLLQEAGYHVLRFDFTGLGESEGDFESSTFVANVGDLVRAASWMIDRGLGPTALVGHSLGGAAVLIAASRIRTVRSVATIGAPARASHVLRHIDEEAQRRARREGCTMVSLAGRTFPISDRFLQDLDAYDEEASISALGVPLMVMHAPDDGTVNVAEGERIFSLAPQPKAFVPLLEADHMCTMDGNAGVIADHLARWFEATAR